MMAAAVGDLPENILKITFLKGLREDIPVEVVLFHPRGLSSLMRLAQQVELRND